MITEFNARVGSVVIVGWRCAVCGTTVDIATPYPFTCPRATPADRHHVLHPLDGRRRWPRRSTTPTRSSPTGRAWRGGRSPGPTG